MAEAHAQPERAAKDTRPPLSRGATPGEPELAEALEAPATALLARSAAAAPPRPLSPRTLRASQRTLGNRATSRLIERRSDAGRAPTLQRLVTADQFRLQTALQLGLDGAKDSLFNSILDQLKTFERLSNGRYPAQQRQEHAEKLQDTVRVWLLTTGKTSAAADQVRGLQRQLGNEIFKARFEKELETGVVNIVGLNKLVGAATAEQKKAVWSDATLMTKAFNALGQQPYLDMLVTLGMAQSGTPAEGGGAHKSGSEADVIIRDKLAVYVVEAVKAGKKVEGSVAIVADADWDRAGEAHYGKDTWNNPPGPGKSPKKNNINAFVDDKNDRIWIHKDRGNAGTAIHEGLHKYAKNDVLSNWGFEFNEGITEFFTRKICKSLPTPIERGNYEENYTFVKGLVDAGVATEAALAKAYFDGDLAGAKKVFIDKHKESVSAETAASRWAKVLEKLGDDNYVGALVWAKP